MSDHGVYASLVAAGQGVRGTLHIQAFVPTKTASLYAYLGLAGTPNVDAGVYLRPQDGLLHAFVLTYPAGAYWEDPPSPQGVAPSDTSWRLEFQAQGALASLTATDLQTGVVYATSQPMGSAAPSSARVKCSVSIAPLGNAAENLSGALIATWTDLELLVSGSWVPWQPEETVEERQYPSPDYSRIRGAPPGPVEVAVYSSPTAVSPGPQPTSSPEGAGLVTGAAVGLLGGALLGWGLTRHVRGQPSVLDRLLGSIGL